MKVSLSLAMRTDFNVCLEKAFTELHPGTPFLPGPHLEMLAWYARLFAEGKVRRLVICLPPRHLKSKIASVALPAWILGRNPSAKISCASYGEDLAKEFSTETRQFMLSKSYTEAFPEVELVKSTDMHLRTSAGGERYATTVGGPITGKGAGFIIVDDPLKVQDIDSEVRRDEVAKWFFNLTTRFNDPNTGGIMLIAQRLHEDDLVGRILERGGWEIVTLPLIATEDEVLPRGPGLYYRRSAGEYLQPARIGKDVAAQIRSEIGHSAFEAQYQQHPLPAGAGSFDLSLLMRYKVAPRAFEYTFFRIDVATIADGGDYSVCTIWGYVEQNFYLFDVWRKQLSFPQLRKAILELDNKWCPSLIVVEAVGSGLSLCQDLENELGRYVVACVPEGNKAHRFEAATLLMEKGRVWIPVSAPWLDTLIKELLAFPNGKHDDQADSISQMLFYWQRALIFARTRGNPKGPRSGGLVGGPGPKSGGGASGAPVTSRIYPIDFRPMPDLW